jgi:hypothetical protein
VFQSVGPCVEMTAFNGQETGSEDIKFGFNVMENKRNSSSYYEQKIKSPQKKKIAFNV